MAQSELELKNHVLRRLKSLEQARSPWEKNWRGISEVFAPHLGRFLGAGERSNEGVVRAKPYNNTGILALKRLAAGIKSGTTSPGRPWFRLGLQDQAMAKRGQVKAWLEYVTDIINAVLNRSNFYGYVLQLYQELGAFGTAVMLIDEDLQTGIRCRTLTVGEYSLAADGEGRVDTLCRRIHMTPRQILDKWPDTTPISIKSAADSVNEEFRQVIHLIEPNPDYNQNSQRQDGQARKYRSIYMLLAGGDILSQSGFYEFPAICPRWMVVGNDVYGYGPAHDAMWDNYGLQKMEYDTSLAVGKSVNPPLVASGNQNPIDTGPGKITNMSTLDQSRYGIRSLYEVRLDLGGAQLKITEAEQRIYKAMHTDLFQMLEQVPHQITALEASIRDAERMQMLGPVLSQLDSEGYHPLIERVYNILWRFGAIPPPPPELAQGEIKIEMINVLAQSLKQAGLAGINNTVAFIGQMAQLTQSADPLDKLNTDAAIDEMADAQGVSAAIILSDEQVAPKREARAQQQQQMQQMAMMQQGLGMAQQGADAARKSGMTPDQMAQAAQTAQGG